MKRGVLRAKPHIVEYTGGMSLNYHSPSLKGGIRSPNNPEREMIIMLILPDVQHLMGGGDNPFHKTKCN